MKLRMQLLLGYMLVFAFMIVLAGITCQRITALVDASNRVAHAQDVIGKAHLVEKLLADMETGQRGFLIAGEDRFLEPYNDGQRLYEKAIDDLAELVSDPGQVERLQEIDPLVTKWHEVAAAPEIAERRKVAKGAVDADYLQKVLAEGVGKGILDSMRRTMDEMISAFRLTGNVRGEFLTESVAKAMVDQETGQRGFLITGNDEFLEPYWEGQEAAKNSITALRTLTDNAHDRAATVNDLNELEKLEERWLKEVGNAEIELRRQVDAGQKTQKDIEDTLGQGKGKAIMDEMRKIMNRMDEMFSKAENNKAGILLVQIEKAMIDQETGQRGFIITGKDEFLEPFTNGQTAFKQALTDLRKLNSNAYDIAGMKGDIDKLEKLEADWLKKAAGPEIAAREQMNKSQGSMKDVAALIEKGTGKSIMDSLRVKLTEFVDVEKQLLAERQKSSEEAARVSIGVTIAGTLLAIVLGIVAALYISRGIMRKVGGEPSVIAAAVEQVAHGDLSLEVGGSSARATGIAASVRTMVGNLRAQTTEIGEAVDVLSSASGEIATSITQVTTGSQETATAVTETTTTVEELKQTADIAADKAQGVSDSAKQASEISQQGMEATEQVSEKMDSIKRQMDAIGESVMSLSEQSQAIGEIISTVDDLAEQSNLLSVNASVEAAKAGEQGKGFAVVAQEIKSMAEQSKESTKQVRSILNDIQKATGATVMASEQGSKAVDEGAKKSVEAGQSIKMLAGSVEEAAQAAVQIAASNRQQATGVEQVSSAMISVKQASEQNADSMKQLESAARNLQGVGQKLNQLVALWKA